MRCPFYGCKLVGPRGNFAALLMPTRVNICALIEPNDSPCRMETEGNAPDWRGCPYNPQINGTYEHGSLESNRRRALMGKPPIESGGNETPALRRFLGAFDGQESEP